MTWNSEQITKYRRYTKSGGHTRGWKFTIGFTDPEQEQKAYDLIAGSAIQKTIYTYGKPVTINGFPARPFIADAYDKNNSLIISELNKFISTATNIETTRWQMTLARREFGYNVVSMVKNFIISNPYVPEKSNSKEVIKVKGENRPLIYTMEMIDSMIPSFNGNHNHSIEENISEPEQELEYDDGEIPF